MSIVWRTPSVVIGTVFEASTCASAGLPSPFGSLQMKIVAGCVFGAKTNMISIASTVLAPCVTRWFVSHAMLSPAPRMPNSGPPSSIR